jgi:autotransporter-associated beta strand protein
VTGNQIFLRNGITTDYADTAGAGPVFIPNIILDESMTINTVTERTLTLNGAVSGSGGLTKNGPGALILSHNNTYTGLTSINAGTVGISADRRVRLSFAS